MADEPRKLQYSLGNLFVWISLVTLALAIPSNLLRFPTARLLAMAWGAVLVTYLPFWFVRRARFRLRMQQVAQRRRAMLESARQSRPTVSDRPPAHQSNPATDSDT